MAVETVFNVTIEDTYPLVTYYPYAGGGPFSGWNSFYTNGTVPSMAGSTYGVGDSFHTTVLNGSSLSFEFYGNTLYLLGKSNGAVYVISMDGGPSLLQTEQSGLLAEYRNLASGSHNVTLTVTSIPSSFEFDKAISTIGTGTTGATIVNQTFDDLNSAWSFDPGWIEAGVHNVPDPSENVHTTTEVGPKGIFSFQGNAVYLFGDAFINHGLYQVLLDGDSRTYNGTAPDWVGDALLFFKAGLDPTVMHVLQVLDVTSGLNVDVDYATVLQVVPDSANPQDSVPTVQTSGTSLASTSSSATSVGAVSGLDNNGISSTASTTSSGTTSVNRSSPSASPSTGIASTSSHSHAAVVVACASAGLLLLILLGMALFFIRRVHARSRSPSRLQVTFDDAMSSIAEEAVSYQPHPWYPPSTPILPAPRRALDIDEEPNANGSNIPSYAKRLPLDVVPRWRAPTSASTSSSASSASAVRASTSIPAHTSTSGKRRPHPPPGDVRPRTAESVSSASASSAQPLTQIEMERVFEFFARRIDADAPPAVVAQGPPRYSSAIPQRVPRGESSRTYI